MAAPKEEISKRIKALGDFSKTCLSLETESEQHPGSGEESFEVLGSRTQPDDSARLNTELARDAPIPMHAESSFTREHGCPQKREKNGMTGLLYLSRSLLAFVIGLSVSLTGCLSYEGHVLPIRVTSIGFFISYFVFASILPFASNNNVEIKDQHDVHCLDVFRHYEENMWSY